METFKPKQLALLAFVFTLVSSLRSSVNALQPHQRTWLTTNEAGTGREDKQACTVSLESSVVDYLLHSLFIHSLFIHKQWVLPNLIDEVTGQ